MFNGVQVNDHIEQDDHTDNVRKDDCTNTLIHDSFNVRMDDDDDDDNENIDDFDDVHDIPLVKISSYAVSVNVRRKLHLCF